MSWDRACQVVVLTEHHNDELSSTSWSQRCEPGALEGWTRVTGARRAGGEGEDPHSYSPGHGDIFEDEIDSCFRIKSELTSSKMLSPLDYPTPSRLKSPTPSKVSSPSTGMLISGALVTSALLRPWPSQPVSEQGPMGQGWDRWRRAVREELWPETSLPQNKPHHGPDLWHEPSSFLLFKNFAILLAAWSLGCGSRDF